MSIVSDIYDDIVTRAEALLTSHVRLPNAYSLEENSTEFLKQGWALAVGPEANTERFATCTGSFKMDFIFSITRRFIAREFDATAKATGDKNLLEDMRLIKNDFIKNSTLNTSAHVANWETRDGIVQILAGEKDNYIALQATVAVEYFEEIS